MRLTTLAVANIKPARTRREIPDDRSPGLHLIVQPSGARSWALRFRRPDGRPAKLTLGKCDLSDTEVSDAPVLGGALTLRQARELAASIDRERARGIDVVEQRKTAKARRHAEAVDRAENNFTAAATLFVKDYRTKRQTRPRRWRDDAAVLGLYYPPGSDPGKIEPTIIKGSLADAWRSKPVADINDFALHTVIEDARKSHGPGRARRLHAALSVLFGWLKQRRRLITTNPMRELARPGTPASRERRLSDAEIVVFWKACDRIGPFGQIAKLLLLTGCRLREVSNMERAELEDSGTWTIPGARTKNHKALMMPLPPLALDIIAGMPPIESKYVFTISGDKPLTGFTKAKARLDREMAKIAGKPVEPWRLHDTRRTFASGLAALGVALPVVERLLNHISGSFGGVAGVYQRHEFATEKADALARWARHVEGLVSGQPDKVVKLRRQS
jgi:integrase